MEPGPATIVMSCSSHCRRRRVAVHIHACDLQPMCRQGTVHLRPFSSWRDGPGLRGRDVLAPPACWVERERGRSAASQGTSIIGVVRYLRAFGPCDLLPRMGYPELNVCSILERFPWCSHCELSWRMKMMRFGPSREKIVGIVPSMLSILFLTQEIYPERSGDQMRRGQLSAREGS